ncbi:aminodeoxychorismate synthase component I [Patescibacteria group bacterium]|nr:aminodeoxychorismate synthase component I [Patescibacteria group bacterium]MBU1703393.1 aminodeoxychorismate synthase component I [Patescibacteria group bacterium]MBU1953907.1 aminodeoxychorismate synthase component I [Patescibacteria group bacterium]
MSLLKIEYEKRRLAAGETLQAFFNHLRGQYACLLESCGKGRYSYIAYDPFLVVWSENDTVQLLQLKNFDPFKKSGAGRIMERPESLAVSDLFEEFRFNGSAPVPFCGGAAGYFSYDFGTRFVGVRQKVFDDTLIPTYLFGFYDKVFAFDHEEGALYVIAVGETDLVARRKIDEMKTDLFRTVYPQRKGEVGELTSNLSRDAYLRKVELIKDLLRKGETYQVNLSQRFSGDCTKPGWAIYKRLAAVNPSPFACYFEYPDFSIVSCSPELLLRKRGLKVESRPIKGTAPRGMNEAEDAVNVARLLASEKENAELSMITDLVRNDLGKVCKVGSVKVLGHREIEKYSHVVHTVSRVGGELEDKKTVFDCLQAIFPGGSITGCPKKRTMEIIDQLEDYKRGVYTGSAGYISFSGDCDFNILIRTMLLKDDKVYFHAGGGIVMDSDPLREYEETLDKVLALRSALD